MPPPCAPAEVAPVGAPFGMAPPSAIAASETALAAAKANLRREENEERSVSWRPTGWIGKPAAAAGWGLAGT